MNTDNLTFIIHIRKDTEERKKNANIVIPYYKTIAPNSKFIVVEDDTKKEFEYLADHNNIQYIHTNNNQNYNKCKSYNIGLTHATTEIVCFLDIDCIISKQNLYKALETVLKSDCVSIGYNGISIYLSYLAKEQIKNAQLINLYEHFDTLVDRSNIYNEFTNDNYHIGNTKAVGGVVIGRNNTFTSVGGFNPNFTGWGYEDNEIIVRMHKLGIPVFYTNTDKPYLFHLPHIDVEKNEVKNHSFYKSNEAEYLKILSFSESELTNYINSWK
jgi:predicted glycosyltransferase involved in capsule biosynthesis